MIHIQSQMLDAVYSADSCKKDKKRKKEVIH